MFLENKQIRHFQQKIFKEQKQNYDDLNNLFNHSHIRWFAGEHFHRSDQDAPL